MEHYAKYIQKIFTKTVFLLSIVLVFDTMLTSGAPRAMDNVADLIAKDKVFNAISDVRNVLADSRQERGLPSISSVCECNHSDSNIRIGLYLFDEPLGCINLATPWGMVKFYDEQQRISVPDRYEDFKAIRKSTKLRFVKNEGEGAVCLLTGRVQIYKEDDLEPISLAYLEGCRDTDTYISSSYIGRKSIYKIESVRGIDLPKPECFSNELSQEIRSAIVENRKKDWAGRLKSYSDFKRSALNRLFQTGSLGIEPLGGRK